MTRASLPFTRPLAVGVARFGARSPTLLNVRLRASFKVKVSHEVRARSEVFKAMREGSEASVKLSDISPK